MHLDWKPDWKGNYHLVGECTNTKECVTILKFGIVEAVFDHSVVREMMSEGQIGMWSFSRIPGLKFVNIRFVWEKFASTGLYADVCMG